MWKEEFMFGHTEFVMSNWHPAEDVEYSGGNNKYDFV